MPRRSRFDTLGPWRGKRVQKPTFAAAMARYHRTGYAQPYIKHHFQRKKTKTRNIRGAWTKAAIRTYRKSRLSYRINRNIVRRRAMHAVMRPRLPRDIMRQILRY